MDEIDIDLILQLAKNSRISYHELADRIGLSVNSVHKRIKTMLDTGIIHSFTANMSWTVMKPVIILIFGRSETRSMKDTIEKLGKSKHIFKVVIAGGNYLYVHGMLRTLSELDGFSSFVKKEGMMPDTTLGIGHIPPEADLEGPDLSKLDYRIIHALHRDSRKATSDVAEELDVSSRTVRRRLFRMQEDNSIRLTIEFVPTASSDIITIMHLTTKSMADRTEIINLLINEYRPNMIGTAQLSNLPELIICTLWTKTMKELKNIQDNLWNEGVFENIIPNIFYDLYEFDSWMDDHLRKKAGAE